MSGPLTSPWLGSSPLANPSLRSGPLANPSFVVVGDVMVDTFARSSGHIALGSDHPASITRHIGGQGANTAAWLAWSKASVTLLAACGRDHEGRWALERLTDCGVDVFLHEVDDVTGQCVVVVEGDGTRTMLSDAGANARISEVADDIWRSVVDKTSRGGAPLHVHVSGYLLERDSLLASRLLAVLHELAPSSTTSLDTAALPPTASHRAGITAALPFLDVLIGTHDELVDLAFPTPPHVASADLPESDAIDRWRKTWGFTGVVVIKRGSAGAVADDGNSRHHVKPASSYVVDTTGAGDAFAAGFLAAWTLGRDDLATALASATQAAAVAISQTGAGPPLVEGR